MNEGVCEQESRDYDKTRTYDNESMSYDQHPDLVSSPVDDHGYLIMIDYNAQ